MNIKLSFGVIETDKYARRTATLHTERKAVEHRKQIKQHIQVRERSAIKQQAVSLTAHYTLAKQFLIARQKQIKAFGHRKREFIGIFLFHTADIAYTAAFLRATLQQGTDKAFGRAHVHGRQ